MRTHGHGIESSTELSRSTPARPTQSDIILPSPFVATATDGGPSEAESALLLRADAVERAGADEAARMRMAARGARYVCACGKWPTLAPGRPCDVCEAALAASHADHCDR